VPVIKVSGLAALRDDPRWTASIELGKPVALDEGSTFAIREGGRIVGAGTVTAILD
jgi:translation elongation factor EF-Tu-like GTPase